MVSISDMIYKLEGMLGFDELSEWEAGFVRNVRLKKNDTTSLSGKQVEMIEKIYLKHFG